MRPAEEEAKQGAAKKAADDAADDAAGDKDGDDDDDDDDNDNDSDPSSTSSSDSDSDDESDFEEVDASEEDAAALSKLEEEMESSRCPPSYEQHLALVALLRKCRMARRLREARKAAAAAFPLPERVWLEWLEDERREAARAQAKAKAKARNNKKSEPSAAVAGLVSLHEAAVADFLSVPIWASYLRALRELDEGVASFTPEGAARFRAVADRALAVAGAHVGKGEALWREARGFELDALRRSSPPSSSADEARARSLFHRQLSTPLLYENSSGNAEEDEDNSSNEHVRRELLEWERERDASFASLPPWLVAAADAACSAADARAASEEAVSPSSSLSSTKEELLAAHLAYLRLEERRPRGGPGGRGLRRLREGAAQLPLGRGAVGEGAEGGGAAGRKPLVSVFVFVFVVLCFRSCRRGV